MDKDRRDQIKLLLSKHVGEKSSKQESRPVWLTIIFVLATIGAIVLLIAKHLWAVPQTTVVGRGRSQSLSSAGSPFLGPRMTLGLRTLANF